MQWFHNFELKCEIDPTCNGWNLATCQLYVIETMHAHCTVAIGQTIISHSYIAGESLLTLTETSQR